MAAGGDIRGPYRGIREVDPTRLAAHDRIRFIDMRQAEGMSEFVHGYVEQHLANIGLATWSRRVEIDPYGQSNNTMLVGVNDRFAHLMMNMRRFRESDRKCRRRLYQGSR